MKKLLITLVLAQAYFSAMACYCTFSGPFVKVAAESDMVVIGTITKKRNSAIQVKIENTLKGGTEFEIIEINGDKGGDSCYEVLVPYLEGDRYAFALTQTNGKYYLSNCGEYKLKIEDGVVIGMVNKQFMADPTTEWPEYNNKTMELGKLLGLFEHIEKIEAPCSQAIPYVESEAMLDVVEEAKAKEATPEDFEVYNAAKENNVGLMEYYSQAPEVLATEGYKKAISFAANSGYIDVVKTAVQKGYDVNSFSEHGLPIIAEAVKYPEIVQYLLLNGADPNLANSSGVTALMRAADEGCLSCIELLIESGADMALENEKGHDAMKFAKKYNEVNPEKVVALLKSYE